MKIAETDQLHVGDIIVAGPSPAYLRIVAAPLGSETSKKFETCQLWEPRRSYFQGSWFDLGNPGLEKITARGQKEI